MPPGSQKRKSAKKKKKKTKSTSNSVSSSPVPSPHRESDGEQLSSPASKDQQNSPGPPVKPETTEGNLFGKNPPTIEKTEKASEVKEGKEGKKVKNESDRGSSSPKQHEKSISRSSSSRDKKKSVVIEPAPVADLVKSFESMPERGLGSAIKTSPIVDQIYNNSKLKENHDLLVARSPMKQKVVNENSSKNYDRSSPKETGVENSVSFDDNQKDSPKSDCLTASTLECPFCGRNSDDGESPECSERQPLLAPDHQEAERTSWKSCCGILGLCSGSRR